MAKRDVADFKKFGKVQRGWLGHPAHRSGARRHRAARRARWSASWCPARPAAQAGIARGDVILKFDGVAVDDAERLRWLSANAGVGKKVMLHLRRGNHEADVALTTVAQPD